MRFLNLIIWTLCMPLSLWAVMTDEGELGQDPSIDVLKPVILTSKIVLPCDKNVSLTDKCNFYAFYDQRDDYIFIVKKTLSQTTGYGEGGFQRDEVAADAHQKIDIVQHFPNQSTEVDNATALFSLEQDQLLLKLKILFSNVSQHQEKTLTIPF